MDLFCAEDPELLRGNRATPPQGASRDLHPIGKPPVPASGNSLLIIFKAGGEIRTRDLCFTKALLCQLSYSGE